MFFGQIERECLSGEIWFIWQETKLPDHLQLLVDQQEVECDIWKLQSQELENKPTHPSMNEDSSALSIQPFNFPK